MVVEEKGVAFAFRKSKTDAFRQPDRKYLPLGNVCLAFPSHRG